ncbi:MAG: dephospho-CoA kinase, partial [bacterium]
TVAKFWEEWGAGVVSGDEMGRRALEKDPHLRKALANHFSSDILLPDGSIHRQRLAEVAFSSSRSARLLTELTFPTLYRLAWEEMGKLGLNHNIVVFDAALIMEWEVESDFDYIVAVIASYDRLVEHAVKKGLTPEEVSMRLNGQLPVSEKARRAHRVITNDGTLDDLLHQAKMVWEELLKWREEKGKSLKGREKG